MARKNKKITIDGHEYNMTQLGALQGRDLWLKLLQVIAEPMQVLANADGLTEATATRAIAKALQSLDRETLAEMYQVFGASCEVRVDERWPKLTDVIFDEHFSGRYVSMSKWLLESVVFNFADFLGDISLGKIGGMMQAAVAASKRPSPTASTGLSGES